MHWSVRFHEFGGPDVLKIEDVVVPDPGFQEVRLRVKAIGLNRSQVLTRSGRSVTKPTLPEAYAAMSRIDAISSTSAAKRTEQLGKVDILFGVAVGPVPVGRLTVSKSNSRRTSSMSDFRPTISSPCCGSGSSMPASASITCCRSAAGRKIQAGSVVRLNHHDI